MTDDVPVWKLAGMGALLVALFAVLVWGWVTGHGVRASRFDLKALERRVDALERR